MHVTCTDPPCQTTWNPLTLAGSCHYWVAVDEQDHQGYHPPYSPSHRQWCLEWHAPCTYCNLSIFVQCYISLAPQMVRYKPNFACWGTQSQDQTTSGRFRHLGSSAKIPGVWPSIHHKPHPDHPVAHNPCTPICVCEAWEFLSLFKFFMAKRVILLHAFTSSWCQVTQGIGHTHVLPWCDTAFRLLQSRFLQKKTCWRDGFFEVWLLICNHVWSSRKDQEWAFLFALSLFLTSLKRLPSYFCIFFQAATQALHPFHQRNTRIQRGGRCWKSPRWSIFPLQVCLWAIQVLCLGFGCWLCTCILQCHNTCCKPKSTAVPRKADQYSFSSIISYTFCTARRHLLSKSCILLGTTTNLDSSGVSLQDGRVCNRAPALQGIRCMPKSVITPVKSI